jgi:DNA-directed RNA polymerase specialized sigma24 family protein
MINPQEIAAQASAAAKERRTEATAELLGQLYAAQVFRHAACYAYAEKCKPQELDVDDLEHEIYLRVQKGIADFDSGVGFFTAWLARVAHNCLVSMLRKTNRFPAIFDEMPERQDTSSSVLETICKNEDGIALAMPFSEEDWDCLVSWGERNPRDPLLVIVGHGFWPKLRGDKDENRHDQWRDWCSACDIHDISGLESRLDELVVRGDSLMQLRVLREYLLLSDTAFRKDWNRKQHLVVELQAFWCFYLANIDSLTDDQARTVLKTEVSNRVPLLCIDQNWHRSQNAAQWKMFRGDFKFNGIPPLLRFIPSSSESERVEWFARSIPGELNSNIRELYGKLKSANSVRKELSTVGQLKKGTL